MAETSICTAFKMIIHSAADPGAVAIHPPSASVSVAGWLTFAYAKLRAKLTARYTKAFSPKPSRPSINHARGHPERIIPGSYWISPCMPAKVPHRIFNKWRLSREKYAFIRTTSFLQWALNLSLSTVDCIKT